MGNLQCPNVVRDYCMNGIIQKERKDRKFIDFGGTLAVWHMIIDRGTMEAICPICEANVMILEVRKNKSKVKGQETKGIWEIGHVKAHANGGNEELSNLRPICKSCNRKMGNDHMIEYCKQNVPDFRLERTLNRMKLS